MSGLLSTPSLRRASGQVTPRHVTLIRRTMTSYRHGHQMRGRQRGATRHTTVNNRQSGGDGRRQRRHHPSSKITRPNRQPRRTNFGPNSENVIGRLTTNLLLFRNSKSPLSRHTGHLL